MKNRIEEVYANVRLQEGVWIVEQLLIECYAWPGISTKELSRKTLLPLPVTAAIKKEFIKAGVLQQNRGVHCTDEGKDLVEKELGYEGLNKDLYKKLMRPELDVYTELNDLLAELQELFDLRPQVNVQIDQSKCTLATSLRRAILCLRQHALIGKRILCVGDDDLVSISLGFLFRRLFPGTREPKTRIDVVDIDARFLEYICKITEQEMLPIQCHQLDLRQPLPTELCAQFDCFFTDPPYTLPGMSLFVSRGISALKQKKGLPIFLSFAHKSPDFMLAMQREFVRMGLTVSSTLPSFNEYEGAEMIANKSQMIVLKTTELTNPEFTGVFQDALYTGEVRRTLRTYCCKQCAQSVLVGFQGDVPTIEELKNKGCSNCQNDTFQLIEKRNLYS